MKNPSSALRKKGHEKRMPRIGGKLEIIWLISFSSAMLLKFSYFYKVGLAIFLYSKHRHWAVLVQHMSSSFKIGSFIPENSCLPYGLWNLLPPLPLNIQYILSRRVYQKRNTNPGGKISVQLRNQEYNKNSIRFNFWNYDYNVTNTLYWNGKLG